MLAEVNTSTENLTYHDTHCFLCGLEKEKMEDYQNCTVCGKLLCYPDCLASHSKSYGHKQAEVENP